MFDESKKVKISSKVLGTLRHFHDGEGSSIRIQNSVDDPYENSCWRVHLMFNIVIVLRFKFWFILFMNLTETDSSNLQILKENSNCGDI